MMRYIITRAPSDVAHAGIKGQHWGHRRFQNPDGTWTDEGQKRYSTDTDGQYGEPGGERKKNRHVKVESSRAPKKRKRMSKRQLKKAHKQAIKEAKREQMKSERTTRLMNAGFKALNAYAFWQNVKDDIV